MICKMLVLIPLEP